MGSKQLHIGFYEIDGFIKNYDGIRYLVVYDSKRYNAIYERIRYLTNESSGITGSSERIRIDSYSSSPIEKILTFYDVVILIKLVVNKNKKEYYYNIFIEKVLIKVNPIHIIFKWMFVYYKCFILIELTFRKELMLIK